MENRNLRMKIIPFLWKSSESVSCSAKLLAPVANINYIYNIKGKKEEIKWLTKLVMPIAGKQLHLNNLSIVLFCIQTIPMRNRGRFLGVPPYAQFNFSEKFYTGTKFTSTEWEIVLACRSCEHIFRPSKKLEIQIYNHQSSFVK